MGIDVSSLWSNRNLIGGLPDKKSYKDLLKIEANIDEKLEPHQHQLYFRKEKRSGKTVTVVAKFFLNKNELEDLHKKLKKSLSVGGTIRFEDHEIEFQGDCETKLRELLPKYKFKFKN